MLQFQFSSNTKNMVKLYLIFAIFLTITIIQNSPSEFLLSFFPGFLNYKELNSEESSLVNESKELDPFFVTGFVDAEGCFSIIFQKRDNFNLGWQVRNYSTDTQITAITNNEINQSKLLHPWFITGFTDAEGCFMIRIIKDKRQKLGWVVKPMFSICLHSKDIENLYEIQKFFKDVGNLSTRTNRDVSEYIVQDINSITNVIIPHFDNYPLQSAKLIDYQLWKECVLLIANKEHLTKEGLEKIVSIKGAINLGLTDQLKIAFPNIICTERPAYIVSENDLNPHWISGFSSGDSSFTFSIGANSVKATYEINLHKREMPPLSQIMEFFNSQGNIYNYQTKNSAMFKLTGNLDHNSLIIPHFEKFPLSGLKLHNYLIWEAQKNGSTNY